jgi:hypothetical protein
MASASDMPCISDIVELRSHGIGVPLVFPLGSAEFVVVHALHLSIRFSLHESTMWVEREIFHPETKLLLQTLREHSLCAINGSQVWELTAGKYRVYGLSDSQMDAPTMNHTPLRSSTCTRNSEYLSNVKTEPGVIPLVNLSDSSDEDVSPSTLKPSPSFPGDAFVTPPCRLEFPSSSAPTNTSTPTSIVQSLKQLAALPGSKNILKKLDCSKLTIQEVSYLPPRFDGTYMFVLPSVTDSASQTKARSMEGMDKRYDGHVWTKTQTTNITNSFGLAFRSSACVGHLQCQNLNCDYLHRVHRSSKLNEIDFIGSTKYVFLLTGPAPPDSTLVCSICKMPPKCVALCDAKIFYVHGKVPSQRACIHLGKHRHPVKVGDCRDSRQRIHSLIEEQVDKTPQATHSKIVLEVSKDIVGDFLLRDNVDKHQLFSLEELEPVFDRCKELNSSHLRNKVTTFKYLRRLGVMDGIAKLRGVSTWAYVQRNQFPGQGDEKDKVFVFKMSEVGPGSGVDLVRRMQPDRDLENAWMMSDHVKRVSKWTTMACHVYDGTYQRIMTIACCDFQSEDKDAQVLFWRNLNQVMARHGIPNPYFKGFMADSAQANWNAVRIVYSSGDPSIAIISRERTCFFHWTQSLVKYTKTYIKHEL